MRWLLAAVVSSALFAVAVLGTFRPLRGADGLQYVFVWSGAPAVLTACLLAAGALGVLYVVVVVVARRRAPEHAAAARSGRWLAPSAALGVVALGVLPAVPGVGERGAVAGYFFYDLRWWWAALLAAWVAVRIDRVLGEPVRLRIRRVESWAPALRLLLLDTAVFVAVVAFAAATTPRLRFSAGLHGDEPKYIRYCESWYQGGGCDLSRKKMVADLPLDAPSALTANVGLFVRAVGQNARSLASDLAAFAADPRGFRWNRAKGREGFLTGKNGTGTYQLHQPGLSAFLLPGYVIDRHLLSVNAGYFGEFPSELVMTNVTMLVLLGLSGVALFRLLRRALGSEFVASLAAGVAMLTLPTTAFAFQFYPEVPALLLILVAANVVWFHAASEGEPVTTRQSRLAWARFLGAGAAAGMLTWLHPRFLVISLALAAIGTFRMRGPTRRAFVAGYVALFGSFLGFIYHVTGSWLPNALYQASEGDVAIDPSGIFSNLLAYAVNGTWGMIPHAPWLIGVVPGLVILGRRSVPSALFVGGVALALAATAAGHGLIAAGGTPGRLILAVLPLLVWPVAVLAQRFWSSPAVRAGVLIVVVLSLDAALAYNWSHEKSFGPMRDASLSGWKPNLAFPEIRGDFLNLASPQSVLFLAVAAGIVALTVIAFVTSKETPGERTRSKTGSFAVGALVLVLVVGWSTAATAQRGRWTRSEYLIGDEHARRETAEAMVALDRCRVCFASVRSQVDWTWLEPNPGGAPIVDVGVSQRTVAVEITFGSDGDNSGFGRVQIDFGDGTASPWTGVVGRRTIAHEYQRTGEYRIVISQQLRGGQRVDRRTIAVGGGD
jgi:hypothetical protein